MGQGDFDWAGFLSGLGGGRIANDDPLSLGVVYGSVFIIANQVSRVPLKLYQKVDEELEPVDNHSILKVLRDPHPYYSWKRMKAAVTTQALIYGNGYLLLERSARGVRQIALAEPGEITINKGAQNGVRAVTYSYNPTNTTTGTADNVQGMLQPRTYSSQDVIHIRTLTKDGVFGLGLKAAAGRAIRLAVHTEDYAVGVFTDGISPSGIITLPEDVDLNEENRAKYAKAVETFRQYNGPMIMDHGTTYSNSSFLPESTQLNQSRQNNRADFSAFTQVPPAMVGNVDRSPWGRGIEQQIRGFLEFALVPWLDAWEEQLNAKLLTSGERDRGYYFSHDTQDLIRGDIQTESSLVQNLVRDGILTPNEGRRRLGYSKIAGGDTLRLLPGATTTETMEESDDQSDEPPESA